MANINIEEMYIKMKQIDPEYKCPHIDYRKDILTADTGDLVCKSCGECSWGWKFKKEREERITKLISDYNEKIKQ
ncbi:MAG: hypothetical protein WC123_04800 [Bacilli bacterium]